MHFRERTFTNHRFTAVAFMFALAVTISLAMAAGAKASDSPIDYVEYIPASETIEVDTISSNLESNFMDDVNPDTSIYALNQYSPQCWTKGLGTFDDNGVDLGNSSYGEDFLISTNDRLIITRKDGTREKLYPYYYDYMINSGEFEVCMIWVNEEKNEITNVVTEFDWDNIPPTEYNPYFDKVLTSIGTYKNTVTVTVNEFESDFPVWHVEKGSSTTFKKTIKITGYDLTKYDKKIPKINYKKFGLGKEFVGDRYDCNFKITWPKVKNAVYYVARIKQIYPVGQSFPGSAFSGKYKTATDYIRTVKPVLNPADYPEGYPDPSYWHTEYGDGLVLSSDTMWQFKVLAIRKTDPEKTGAIFAYGPYSKQVNLFLSKNKTFKAKGKKKSVKLTWNKIGKATGYKIKYSKKKNMSKAKTITVKGAGRTFYTVKKLKKKTKYYFQITPYKTYKKVTYNGFTSAKKAAKTK